MVDKYKVVLADGSTFIVEAEGGPPSEQEVIDYIAANPNAAGGNNGFVNNTPPASAENSGVVGDRRTDSLPGDPSTIGFIKNLANEVIGMGRGAVSAIGQRTANPETMAMPNQSPVPGMVNFVANRVGEYVDDPLNAIYSKPASFLSEVAGAAGAAPMAGRVAKATGRGIARNSGVLGAAAKGAAKHTPVVGPMVRGAMNEVAKHRKATTPKPAAPNPNAGGRLVKAKAPVLEDEIMGALQAEMGTGPQRVGLTPEPRQTTLGKPSVGAGQYDEMAAGGKGVGFNEARTPQVTEPNPPPPKSPRQAEFEAGEAADREFFDAQGPATSRIAAQPSDARMDELVQKFGGTQDSTSIDWAAEEEKARAAQMQADRLNREHAAWAQGPKLSNANTQWPDPVAPPEMVDVINADYATNAAIQSEWDSSHIPRQAPEAFRSTEPVPWHSGEEPGSPEAAMGSRVHKAEAEMDADYKRRMADPLAGLLLPMILEEMGLTSYDQ